MVICLRDGPKVNIYNGEYFKSMNTSAIFNLVDLSFNWTTEKAIQHASRGSGLSLVSAVAC